MKDIYKSGIDIYLQFMEASVSSTIRSINNGNTDVQSRRSKVYVTVIIGFGLS